MLLDNRKTRVLEVEVTEEDIRQGKPYFSMLCPLALALNREFGGSWAVGLEVADLRENGAWSTRFIHDGDFVSAFDRGRAKPCRVRLTPLD